MSFKGKVFFNIYKCYKNWCQKWHKCHKCYFMFINSILPLSHKIRHLRLQSAPLNIVNLRTLQPKVTHFAWGMSLNQKSYRLGFKQNDTGYTKKERISKCEMRSFVY